MIRFAERKDLDQCVELMRESFKYAEFKFDFLVDYARALFLQHISTDGLACIVLEHKDEVKGLLLVNCKKHPFGNVKVAGETLWYIAPSARGKSAITMLKKYEEWAKYQNCDIISMASLHKNDVSKLYERLGYAPIETHFIKAL